MLAGTFNWLRTDTLLTFFAAILPLCWLRKLLAALVLLLTRSFNERSLAKELPAARARAELEDGLPPHAVSASTQANKSIHKTFCNGFLQLGFEIRGENQPFRTAATALAFCFVIWRVTSSGKESSPEKPSGKVLFFP